MMAVDFVFTKMRDLRRWAETGSLWSYGLSLSCCGLEFHGASSPRYDWQRFGSAIRSEADQADILLVMGPITKSNFAEIEKAYEQMPDPKFVISIGSCANTGGMFAQDNEQVLAGVDTVIPVDVFVPGCPPRPEAIIHALMRLQEKITHAQRI